MAPYPSLVPFLLLVCVVGFVYSLVSTLVVLRSVRSVCRISVSHHLRLTNKNTLFRLSSSAATSDQRCSSVDCRVYGYLSAMLDWSCDAGDVVAAHVGMPMMLSVLPEILVRVSRLVCPTHAGKKQGGRGMT